MRNFSEQVWGELRERGHRLTEHRAGSPTGAWLAGWAYDPAGAKGQVDHYSSATPDGTVSVWVDGYDDRYQPTQQRWVVPGAGTFRMATTYTPAGQPATITYPADESGNLGETITYAYDTATGEAAGMDSSAGDIVSDVDYHPAGMFAGIEPYDGLVARTYLYDDWNRLTWSQAGWNGATGDIQQLGFGYDDASNVTSIRDVSNDDQHECFQYDHRNRLTRGFTGNPTCTTYDDTTGAGTYDVYYDYYTDGRIQHVDGTPFLAGYGGYTYADPDHRGAVTMIDVQGLNFGGYGYDDGGNMVTRTVGNPFDGYLVQTLSYDEFNRLESITQGSNATVYLYDANGNRVARRDGSSTTVQIDGVFEWNPTDALTVYFQIAGQTVLYVNTNSGLGAIFTDHRGSTATVVTPDGQTERQRYYPYGQIRTTSGGIPTEYGYTGQRLDPTGLMDYDARQYDPLIGRFTQPDTIVPNPGDPQDLGRYTYVNNNPVTMSDPSGRVPCMTYRCPDGAPVITNSGTTHNDQARISLGGYPAIPGRPRVRINTGPVLPTLEFIDRDPSALRPWFGWDWAQQTYKSDNWQQTKRALFGIDVAFAMSRAALAAVDAFNYYSNRPVASPTRSVAAAWDDLDALAASGRRVIADDGLTRAAQKLQQHGGQGNLPVISGSVAQRNALATDLLDDILTSPGTRVVVNQGGNFAGGRTFIDELGRGAVYDADGVFQYFGVFD